MAKLPVETTENLWHLKRRLLDIVDEATAAEFVLFESFGETDSTIIVLDELKDIAQQAASRFSQLSSLQLRVAVPALERSVEEIKIEWSLL